MLKGAGDGLRLIGGIFLVCSLACDGGSRGLMTTCDEFRGHGRLLLNLMEGLMWCDDGFHWILGSFVGFCWTSCKD